MIFPKGEIRVKEVIAVYPQTHLIGELAVRVSKSEAHYFMACHREASPNDRTLSHWVFDRLVVECEDGVRLNLEQVIFNKQEALDSPLEDEDYTFKFSFNMFGSDPVILRSLADGLEMWP